MVRLSKRGSQIVALAVGLMVCTSAYGYIPPAGYLLHRLVQIRTERKLTSIKVVMQTTLIDGAQKNLVTDTVWYSAPWKMRQERQDDRGTRVVVSDGRRMRIKEPQGSAKTQRAALDLMAEFFACAEDVEVTDTQHRDRLLGDLKRMGVDTQKRVLTRFDGRIAILLGADPWDSKTPHVLLDKDRLVPLRFVYAEGPERRVDIRLMGYGGAKTGSWFPEVIEVYVNDQLVRRSVVEEITVSPKLTPKLFSLK